MSWQRLAELDVLSSQEIAEQIGNFSILEPLLPRRYSGYPAWPLPPVPRRWWPTLDAALLSRRCASRLGVTFPDARAMGRLLQSSHGITGDSFRGPAPSAGGLQALELFLAHWQSAWLPPGVYHYDRRGHNLAQLAPRTDSKRWRELIPSLHQIEGGALLLFIIGDGRRVAAKYGEHGDRFLLLEAGHLMQNLCLVSSSLGLATTPLGGCLHSEIARELQLLPSDRVLYAGICGRV
jgi:SagB-type dehydrogenase family enzyme